MNHIVVGVDIAKRVFQLYWVEPETGEIVALQLSGRGFWSILPTVRTV
jgi:transposase